MIESPASCGRSVREERRSGECEVMEGGVFHQSHFICDWNTRTTNTERLRERETERNVGGYVCVKVSLSKSVENGLVHTELKAEKRRKRNRWRPRKKKSKKDERTYSMQVYMIQNLKKK